MESHWPSSLQRQPWHVRKGCVCVCVCVPVWVYGCICPSGCVVGQRCMSPHIQAQSHWHTCWGGYCKGPLLGLHSNCNVFDGESGSFYRSVVLCGVNEAPWPLPKLSGLSITHGPQRERGRIICQGRYASLALYTHRHVRAHTDKDTHLHAHTQR